MLSEKECIVAFLLRRYCNGIMGVPITFLDKYNPEQFYLLGIANSARYIDYECYTIINNKKIYNRLIICKKL